MNKSYFIRTKNGRLFNVDEKLYDYVLNLEEENKKYKDQQKEFIRYMNDIIEDLETDDADGEEMKGYLIQRINTFKEILAKYIEINNRR